MLRFWFVAALIVPAATALSTPAAAQTSPAPTPPHAGIQRTPCLWETAGHRFANGCPQPVNAHICVTTDMNGAGCETVAKYRSTLLQPGASVIAPVRNGSFAVPKECVTGQQFTDWTSVWGGGSHIVCRVPPVAPVANPGYTGFGAAPNFSARPATLRNGNAILADSDYPALMAAMLIEAPVTVSIAVDARGRPTGCRIEKTSGYRALDSAACGLIMNRARFNPAKDDAGNPVEGVVKSQTLRWTITL